jgi:hypothetical protein
VSKPVLTVIFGDRDLAAQAAHLVRGALLVPEPEPLPEPFAEIVLRIETTAGTAIELTGRVLQILTGRGIAVAFDDMVAAKAKLAPLFVEAERGGDEPTFIFWGRSSAKKSTKPPPKPAQPAPSKPEGEPADEPPPAAAEVDVDEATKLVQQIAAMTTSQKMQLAMHGERTARLLLLKDVNKNIQTFIIQNARITLEEVRYIAGFRQASPDVLNTIANNRDWTNNPNVVSALIRNPKTPGTTAVKLLDKLSMAEVRRLAKSTDVPRAVTVAARKRVADGA